MIDNYVKFFFIALCFSIALCSYWFCRSKKDWAYLAAAMGFTMVSDYFLVLAHNYRAGVFVFCFVHIAYILRVSGWAATGNHLEKSLSKIGAIICGGGLIFVVFAFVPALPWVDPLIVLAIVYASLFAQNFADHIRYYRQGGPNRKIMLTGLILFILCDIHVMLFNLPNFLPVPPEIGLWGWRWIWVFYAPSQLLLSVSAVRWGEASTAPPENN